MDWSSFLVGLCVGLFIAILGLIALVGIGADDLPWFLPSLSSHHLRPGGCTPPGLSGA